MKKNKLKSQDEVNMSQEEVKLLRQDHPSAEAPSAQTGHHNHRILSYL